MGSGNSPLLSAVYLPTSGCIDSERHNLGAVCCNTLLFERARRCMETLATSFGSITREPAKFLGSPCNQHETRKK